MGIKKINELQLLLFDLEFIITENQEFEPHRDHIFSIIQSAEASDHNLARLALKLIDQFGPRRLEKEIKSLTKRFDQLDEYFRQNQY